jgi:N-acetyl-anhydromuramoyl-L-alanine amidase
MRDSFRIDEVGIAANARWIPSPNCDERPAGMAIELLVVHAISLPPGEFGGDAVVQLFTNRLDPDAHPYFRAIVARRVSAHFFIRRTGELLQFVACARRAWHAGVSTWRGRERCNDFSIGIELEGCDDVPFEPRQYRTLARLSHALQERYPIADVAGHADIAPGRKTDPGPFFEWAHYRRLLTQLRHSPSARA